MHFGKGEMRAGEQLRDGFRANRVSQPHPGQDSVQSDLLGRLEGPGDAVLLVNMSVHNANLEG